MHTKDEVVQWLRDVSTGKCKIHGTGLCAILNRELGSGHRITMMLKTYMARWPEGRKWSQYPVNHPSMDNQQAYFKFNNMHWCMNGRSPYGMERRKLAKYLAIKLESTIL
jgi:hypothetical protein